MSDVRMAWPPAGLNPDGTRIQSKTVTAALAAIEAIAWTCTCPVNGWWGIVPPSPCPVHGPSDLGLDFAPVTPSITTTSDRVFFVQPPPAPEQGWECPRCHIINSPRANACSCPFQP